MPPLDEPLAGRIELRPSWRVVRIEEAGTRQLESELRRLDRDYELITVTQTGDSYTLFWRLRARAQSRNGMRVNQE